MGDKIELSVEDMSIDMNKTELRPTLKEKKYNSKSFVEKTDNVIEEEPMISCLRNETITVRFIPRETGMITNPKHIFYGGMGEMAVRIFTVPISESSGQFVNVLTNSEKNFLESSMGLEFNALSKYLKGDKNFWRNFKVRLTKGDNYLDLRDPNDYIKYKVLLSNKDFIAASLTELQETPKLTYQFVLISKNEEIDNANKELTATMQAYLELGKIQENFDVLKLVVETIDGRPISNTSKLEFVQSKVHKLIQADPKLFVNIIRDPYLETKVLIAKAVEKGVISKRGDFYYYSNVPLCEDNEDPVLGTVAKYLNKPKYQTVKLSIEAKIK